MELVPVMQKAPSDGNTLFAMLQVRARTPLSEQMTQLRALPPKSNLDEVKNPLCSLVAEVGCCFYTVFMVWSSEKAEGLSFVSLQNVYFEDIFRKLRLLGFWLKGNSDALVATPTYISLHNGNPHVSYGRQRSAESQ